MPSRFFLWPPKTIRDPASRLPGALIMRPPTEIMNIFLRFSKLSTKANKLTTVYKLYLEIFTSYFMLRVPQYEASANRRSIASTGSKYNQYLQPVGATSTGSIFNQYWQYPQPVLVVSAPSIRNQHWQYSQPVLAVSSLSTGSIYTQYAQPALALASPTTGSISNQYWQFPQYRFEG